MNYQELCEASLPIVKQAGAFIKEQVGKVRQGDIEEKALNSLVSYVDRKAEQLLVKGLQTLLPDATFLTEEETVQQTTGTWQWIIDPLDGTTNFLHQLPVFSVSVALRHQEQLVLGIVYEVNQEECFYAWRGGGAYLNGKRIRVTATEKLANSLIATGFPYYDYEKTDKYLEVLKYFIKNTRGVRRFGSAAVDLAYVACGRFDAFYEYSLNAWDVAAGILLVQEAGGQVSDFRGGDDYLFGKEMIASNQGVFEVVKDFVRNTFS